MAQRFEDGIPLKRKTAEFRTRFKDAIMCAYASGFGSTLMNAAGMPRMGRSMPSADIDANGGVMVWESFYSTKCAVRRSLISVVPCVSGFRPLLFLFSVLF